MFKHASRASQLVLLLIFVGFAGLLVAQAQDQAPMPIHWTATFPSPQHLLQSGQKISLALTADIDSGWHVYAFPQPPGSPVIPTEVTVPDGQALTLSGEIKPPKAISQVDPTVGKETDLYENSVTFDLPLKVVSKKARAGKQSLEFDIRYQACNNRLCLPPRTDKVEVPVEIVSRP
ncbi:MAG: protein-disulfide reductase DsbD N-terminal domain-containing protein [Candidatus Acidiferrales bacterium]